MQKTLFAIVSYNSKRYMQECIQSIRDKVSPGSYLLSVVDNASTDGIAEWLSEQPDILLTQNTKNVGFGPACNQAVKATIGTDFEDADVFLLNNDTVMTSTALPRMTEVLYSSDDIGAVGAVSSYAGNRQQLDVEFDTTEDYIRFGESLQIPEADRMLEKVRLNGFALLIRRSVWNAVGGFDEDFAPGYYEDDALSIDMLKKGYRLILSRDSFIYHVGSASFVKSGMNNLAIEHHDLFIQKYGFDIVDYAYPSGAVMSQIPFARSDAFKVLMLGSGLGAELKAIRSLFPNSDTYGIETNPVLYEISSHTETVYQSIADLSKSVSDRFFNLLIVDSSYPGQLNDDEKQILAQKCSSNAVEISLLHEYDDFPFDNIRLIIWDNGDFNKIVSDMWASWGIMSTTCSEDDLRTGINLYGIMHENILCISSDPDYIDIAMTAAPDILTAQTTIIPYLTAHFGRLKVSDPDHTNAARLDMFRQKLVIGKDFPSHQAFLEQCGITVSIERNCIDNIDQILRLVNDHSLLDYTKTDIDSPHLQRLLTNDWNDCACITARDNYFDYGTVGFYCFNQREQIFYVYAFSWVVTGMGIEQYIYNSLGCPVLEAKEPVYTQLSQSAPIPWIKEGQPRSSSENSTKTSSIRILLKGSDDLRPIEDYLIGGNITTEYGVQGNRLPSRLYTSPYHIIIYSLIQDDYLSWENDSDAMLAELFESLDNLCNAPVGDPAVILLLGAEIPYESGSDTDKKLAELHSELNPMICDFVSDHPTVKTINLTDYIHDQSDFYNSASHFSVRVYSDIVADIVTIINDKLSQTEGLL